jgi:nitrite reductase/ring-hydroxylating ferredoxin subunit
MKAYFSFLKKSGDHLDTKTRDLISVITKVAVQTDAGFRQYLTRALRNGCTPNEVIDALLMAFPVLGLAKIVWATDILLEMDIPEFRPEALFAEASWHDLGEVSALKDGETTWLEVDGRHLFVYQEAESIIVYDSRCPHQVTDIPHLSLEGNKLTCPKHHWAFDVRTGECIEIGKHPLKRFPHKTEANRLYAFW